MTEIDFKYNFDTSSFEADSESNNVTLVNAAGRIAIISTSRTREVRAKLSRRDDVFAEQPTPKDS
jgi:hypothetical protein